MTQRSCPTACNSSGRSPANGRDRWRLSSEAAHHVRVGERGVRQAADGRSSSPVGALGAAVPPDHRTALAACARAAGEARTAGSPVPNLGAIRGPGANGGCTDGTGFGRGKVTPAARWLPAGSQIALPATDANRAAKPSSGDTSSGSTIKFRSSGRRGDRFERCSVLRVRRRSAASSTRPS